MDDYFTAVNDRQLGICLRMLFADGLQGLVETVINSKNKIEFHISVDVDKERFEMLQNRYKTLIS